MAMGKDPITSQRAVPRHRNQKRAGSATAHSTVRERFSMCLTSVSYEPGDAAGFGRVTVESGRGSTTVASWL